MPYFFGVLALVVIWVIYVLITRHLNPLLFAVGKDGRASSSKFQFLLWTCMVIFAYVAIYSVKARSGDYGPFTEVPNNLLILMGISGGSMVGAKVITSVQVSKGTTKGTGKANKDKGAQSTTTTGNGGKKNGKAKTKGLVFKYLIYDDDDNLSLNQLQMIAWTLIALCIYFVLVIKQVGSTGKYVLPNVDASLLTLMGISQGAYLATKAATTTTAVLRVLHSPKGNGVAAVGEVITLEGKEFGDEPTGGEIKIISSTSGNTVFHPSKIDHWSDELIAFSLPSSMPPGTYNVSIVFAGKESNSLTMTIQ